MTDNAHGRHRRPRRRWPWIAAGVAVLVLAGAGTTYAVVDHSSSPAHASTTGAVRGHDEGSDGTTTGADPTTTTTIPPLAVASTSPASGAKDVASNAAVTIRFSSPVTLRASHPSLSPAVPGTWTVVGARTLRFTPSRAMVPYTTETVRVPAAAVRGTDGASLTSAVTTRFTVAAGSTTRLQQLLAELDYLPVSFTPRHAAVSARNEAETQPGSFAWRWSGLPTQLTSLWNQSDDTVITKAAVMTFEQRNGMAVDGVAGPMVWKTLLHDAATSDKDSAPYDYVLVTKDLPEHLELWSDGQVKFTSIPVNTGAPGADTTDGTYPVFEHVTASNMSGTNPDGTTYDDANVPWASFFHGGDALHGFVRAQYGFPQSNGCVEMQISDAAMVWPYTPIGTLVTVIGPAS